MLLRMADDMLRHAPGHVLRLDPAGASKHLQGFDIDEDSEQSIAVQLQEAMSKASVRIIDLFLEWDDDGSGTISRDEFQRAMVELEYRAPMEEIDALFLMWRSDQTGVLELKELERLLRRGANVTIDTSLQAGGAGAIETKRDSKIALRKGGVDKAGSTLLQGFGIDEASELSVAEQLCDALCKAAVHVVDLFREWDDDNSGTVSREEFRCGMAQMGLEAAAEEVDKVFDAFDPDGSGSVELKEFERLLRRGSSVTLNTSLQAGGAGAIETKRDSKIALRKGKKPEQAATLSLDYSTM